MAAKHTHGLLVRDTSGYPKPDIRAASGRAVAVTWGVCASLPASKAAYEARTEEDRANADRIVAAWNACDGISTEALQPGAVRELLAALQAIYNRHNAETMAQARAAMAKATGGAL